MVDLREEDLPPSPAKTGNRPRKYKARFTNFLPESKALISMEPSFPGRRNGGAAAPAGPQRETTASRTGRPFSIL